MTQSPNAKSQSIEPAIEHPMKTRVFQVAYVVTHPIQYQSPLLRLLSAHPQVDLEVIFLSDFSLKTHVDAEFGVAVDWGVPLTDGFSSQFVKSSFAPRGVSFFNPKVSLLDLWNRLKARQWDAIWVCGHANTGLLTALVYARAKGIPMLIKNDSNPYLGPASWKKKLINRWLVKHAHGLLYCGSANRQHYLDYGARTSQLFEVPLAVDNQFFRTAPQNSTEISDFKKDNEVIFLFAAKITERKNARLLLRSFAQLSKKQRNQSHLVFVGDGPERSSIEIESASLNLTSRVHFLGFKNQAELPAYYFDCDVFVLPSEKEPFAVVVNEAMNASKPLILSDEVGAHYDLLEHGTNGWLVKTGDIDSLTHALSSAIDQPTELPKMGRASIARIENWSFEADVVGIVNSLNAIPEK